ncbi:MarR family winged helix-turn-helix transcriptional regulator [Umezawaea endophytica]|uniref:MarR family winged helix-turn-helix transcriptional regulator n=1 Tax=Umezawaea endophytica TaxID=1654476 RepID=A0A9X2VS09_9PSEU|nr:MarR family winged helix-turn-helix transcriptional regulator [Umezawaea endophytica]MCS7480488.1 MarR family winged helix-turn-helix transcriptional regulator [Umezawaea endophytica]
MPEVPGVPPAQQLLVGLARLGQAVRIDAWRNNGPHNLSPLQADIVTFLAEQTGPRRQGDVVGALASTPPTVSDAVKALRAKGLLESVRDPQDGRATVVRLTPEGDAEARRLGDVSQVMSEAFSVLSEADLAAMLRGTATIMKGLQDRQAIPVSRMCLTCRFFRPNAHPHDAARPHHCAFVDAPFGDAELRVTCPDHQDRD